MPNRFLPWGLTLVSLVACGAQVQGPRTFTPTYPPNVATRSPSPPPVPVVTHAEQTFVAGTNALVRASVASLMSRSIAPQVDLELAEVQGCRLGPNETACIHVRLFEQLGGVGQSTAVRVTVDTTSTSDVGEPPRPDEAPAILEGLTHALASDPGDAPEIVGVAACDLVVLEGLSEPEQGCAFGAGEGEYRTLYITSSSDEAAVSLGSGVQFGHAPLATRVTFGRDFTLLALEPAAGISAADGDGVVAGAARRVDGTAQYPIVVGDAVRRLRASFAAWAGTQSASIATMLARAKRDNFGAGAKTTAPKTLESVRAAWQEPTATLRVVVRRQLRVAQLLCDGNVDDCPPEGEAGVDLEQTFELDRKGVLIKSTNGSVRTYPEQSTEE